jgi:hypothetical protein
MSEEAARTVTTVKLLNLLDIERGASLHAESAMLAERIAGELSEGMTQAERIATHKFLTQVANAVRWPGSRRW